MNRNAFREYVKPFLVLVCICLVVSALLAYTNSITAPVIAENAEAEAQATRIRLLPQAAGFTEITVDDSFGLASVYQDNGGSGYIITAASKGYKGDIVTAVAVDLSGKVVALSTDVSTETAGVGTKAGESGYLNKYIGISGNADSVDTISGATYSSRAVRNCVREALTWFESMRGAAK